LLLVGLKKFNGLLKGLENYIFFSKNLGFLPVQKAID